jgi:putative FmdB family regulatory protein
MPIYVYNCSDCGQSFDELVRKSDDEPSECKHCKSSAIAKGITAPGGYHMDSGPSSVRPRGAGSFKGRK